MQYQVHFLGEGSLLYANRLIKSFEEYKSPSEIPTFDTEDTPITASLKMMSEVGKVRIEFFRAGPILAADTGGEPDEVHAESGRRTGPLSKEEMEKLTVKELDEIAASLGITNLRGLRKQEKIDRISDKR